MRKRLDRKYQRFKAYQISLEAILSNLERLGDFDANSKNIRDMAIILLETMVYVRHMKAELDKLKNDSVSEN